MEKECVFCEIDPIKTRILEEDELYFVALSNPQLVSGHLLVIPKRHIEDPYEISQEEWNKIGGIIRKYQKKIKENFATGVDLRQNYRPFIPQGRVKIDHLHYHLLPRENKDKLWEVSGQFENSLWKDLTEEEVNRFKILYTN